MLTRFLRRPVPPEPPPGRLGVELGQARATIARLEAELTAARTALADADQRADAAKWLARAADGRARAAEDQLAVLTTANAGGAVAEMTRLRKALRHHEGMAEGCRRDHGSNIWASTLPAYRTNGHLDGDPDILAEDRAKRLEDA